VGVLGDESCADAGEESVSNVGGLWPVLSAESCFGATDVTFDPTTEPIPESRIWLSSVTPLLSLTLGDLIVLALEPLDLTETLDLSSLSLEILPNHEFLELGLASASASS
jgi:hypothetical protein